MAGSGIGNLTVFLGLDAAQFDTGLTKAQKRANDFGYAIGVGIRKSAELAIASLTALGAAGGAALLVINQQAQNIAAFQGLADRIGDTASKVSSLQLAADLSGTALDTVAGASVKLTTALANGGDAAKKVEAGLKAIGIKASEFKQLSPVEQIDKVAKSLADYRDGAEKTAVAVALFGESGAQMIGFLNDQANAQSDAIRLTDDQIARADAYTKELARQKSQLSAMTQVVVAESLPALSAFMGVVSDTAKEVLGLSGTATDLKNNTSIRDFANDSAVFLANLVDMGKAVAFGFEYVGKTIGATAAIAAAAARGEFSSISAIMDAAKEDGQEMLKRWNAPSFSDQVRERIAVQGSTAAAAANSPVIKPRIKYTSPTTSGAAGDLLKKRMESELKLLENSFKREEDILRDRNKMLDLVNDQNLISFAEYYGGRRAAAEEALHNQTALLDQEIAQLQAYRDKAAKAEEREAAQGKINDLLERKARLQRDASTEAISLGYQESKAYENLRRSIDGVNASILEMLGLSGDAARIRFDDANKDLRARLTAQGDTGGIAQLDRLRQLTVDQADFNQKQLESSDIIARLQIQEDRLNVARNLGALGELSGLQKATQLRKDAVAQMESQVLALEAISEKSNNQRLVLQAEQARAAWEKLRAESDLVAQRFDTIFSDAGSSAFTDFIMGTKSASDAFRSFSDTVVTQLVRMASQDLFAQLFGGGGSSGGGAGAGFFGEIFSKLFGGGRAVGGAVSPGMFYEVNERGPELFEQGGRAYLMTGGRGGRVIPNSGGGGSPIYVSVAMPQGGSRETALQFGRTAAQQISIAQSRNG